MKRIFNIISIWVGFVAFSQVGIATQTPKTSLHIAETNRVPQTQAQGVIFPHFSTDRRAEFDNIEVGMLIYNTTKKCIEMYLGYYNNQHNWTCIKGSDNLNKNGHSLAVIPSGFTGEYYINTITFDETNTVKWTITNNGKDAVSHIDFRDAITLYNGTAQVDVKPNQNTDISIPAGGTVTLVYALTGTPTGGELKAVFNHIGLYAEQTIQVSNPRYIGKQTYTRKEEFYRDDCEAGYHSEAYKLSKDYTGIGISDISQAAADENALNYAKAKANSDNANFKKLGQERANKYATCTKNDSGPRNKGKQICYYRLPDTAVPDPREPWRMYFTSSCNCDEARAAKFFGGLEYVYGYATNWDSYREPHNPINIIPGPTCEEEKAAEEKEKKEKEKQKNNNWNIPPASVSIWSQP